jgi:hypothetical protein
MNTICYAAKKKPALIKKKVKITGDTTLNFKLPKVSATTGGAYDMKQNVIEGASISAIKKGHIIGTSTNTDKNGKWELYLLRGKSYKIRCDPPLEGIEISDGDAAVRTRAVTKRLEISVPQSGPLWIKMGDGYFYDGKILDEKGQPAIGSGIFALDTVNDEYYGGIGDLEKATFKMNLPSRNFDFHAIRVVHLPSDKFPTYGNKKVGKKIVNKDSNTTVRMTKANVMQGLVKDKNGKIPYAALNFMSYADKNMPWMRSIMAINLIPDSSTFTDAAVKYTYKAGLNNGTYAIQIIPLHMQGLDIPYSQRATILNVKQYNINQNKKANFVLPEGKIVSGKVTDKQGNPLASVLLMFTTAKNQAKLMSDRNVIVTGTITSDKGEYYIPLPPGTYFIYVIPTPEEAATERDLLVRELSQEGIEGYRALYLMNRIIQGTIDDAFRMK